MFQGSIVAIITPWKNGKLDKDALARLIEFQIENGTKGIVPAGTTGESATMTHDEHHQVIAFTVEQVRKRVAVIAGSVFGDGSRPFFQEKEWPYVLAKVINWLNHDGIVRLPAE